MTQASLGEMLRASKNAVEANKLKALQDAALEKSEEEQEKLEAVLHFFEKAKKAVVRAITAGKVPKPIQLGAGENMEAYSALDAYAWYDPTHRIDKNPHSTYRPVWDDFAQWASDNDLIPALEYCHDGVGIQSWHVLTVTTNP